MARPRLHATSSPSRGDARLIISRSTADHYTWGDNCDGWRLFSTPDLRIIHERMPPGTSELRHHHVQTRQFFFVLGGVLDLEIEGAWLRIRAHHGAEVPPGARHQAVNGSDEEAEFLVISQPAPDSDRVNSR